MNLKQAIKDMLKDGEFPKLIKLAKGRDKTNAKLFYDSIKDFNDKDFDKVPEIVILKACKSWTLWQEIYLYLKMQEQDEIETNIVT